MRFACRQCRALLPGYIHRELDPEQRERVSRHLTNCSSCYVAYTEQRQLVHELAYSLPRIGGDAPRLDKMRSAIMIEMARPAQPAPRARIYLARYSLVAIILTIALLLPWSMRSRSFALPPAPQPETVTPQGTAVVAVPTEAATLTATLQLNYPPPRDSLVAKAGATDTP